MIPADGSPASVPAADAQPAATAAQAVAPPHAPPRGASSWGPWAVAVVALVAAAVAATMAWNNGRRLQVYEEEVARRQQAVQEASSEARVLARAAQDVSRDVTARLALVEARVAESALQRSQLEELIQSLSRSRDENVLSDTEAALRVALQQSAITGGPEPLVAALRQADERLARVNQPRLERVRRAVARDLERVRAAQVADIGSLTLRLDEVTRLVDELPLLSAAQRLAPEPAPRPAGPAVAASGPAAATAASGWARWRDQASALGGAVWQEARSLVRLTEIREPEAMLLAPEHALFLRENLKLRLLNARLALLSRQFDLAQADLREAEAVLARYFDRQSRRVLAAAEQLKQVGALSRNAALPRPDDTLAALATAAAGR